MQAKSIGACESPADDDLRDQAIVLRHVLALNPTNLTLSELAREICEDAEDFAQGDALARAVRDLTAAGLLQSNGVIVMPTRAALHFQRLSDV